MIVNGYVIAPDANLRYAKLRDANLRNANLRGANLYLADLRGANLCGAHLCGANLYLAHLRGANLCGADLYNANLRNANLRGTDLCSVVAIVDAGQDWRGYRFVARQGDRGLKIAAGCRWFTADEALAHWSAEGKSAECLAKVRLLIEEAARREWKI